MITWINADKYTVGKYTFGVMKDAHMRGIAKKYEIDFKASPKGRLTFLQDMLEIALTGKVVDSVNIMATITWLEAEIWRRENKSKYVVENKYKK